MDSQQLNELMQSKVSAAHSQGMLTRTALIAVLLALVLGGAFVVYRAVNPPEIVPSGPSSAGDSQSTSSQGSPQEGAPQDSGAGSSGGETSAPSEDPEDLIDHQLQLVWFDIDPDTVDQEILISVLHEDEIAADFALTAENDWKYQWQDHFHAEDMILLGNFSPEMSVSFSISGENFTLTAAYQSEESSTSGHAEQTAYSPPPDPTPTAQGETSLPQTGADWMPVLVCFTAGTFLVLKGSEERRREELEE